MSVKQEPLEVTVTPESIDVDAPRDEDITVAGAFHPPPVAKYTTYQASIEINYDPEDAIQEGIKMISTLEESLSKMTIGNKLREQVWDRELKTLGKEVPPATLIAVCGATGVGKSSVINAVLEDNVVPTSGMRACTSTVTRISYHDDPKKITGEVSFLTRKEWEEELAILLRELADETDEGGNIANPNSEAGIAWQKVHALYPDMDLEQLVTLTVREIIDLDPEVSEILDTTEYIKASTSKRFGKKIAKFINSEEATEEDQSCDGTKRSLWPLVRQVDIRCNALALSTGAIIVDLPGVADSNAARNKIANAFMAEANCFWIVAPIQRAVDDKTARDLYGDAFKMQLQMDGSYDDRSIAFIATKCDDISCSELIKSLGLKTDPKLQDIERRMADLKKQISDYDKRLKQTEREIPLLEKKIAHAEGLDTGMNDTIEPIDKKRKNSWSGKEQTPKRSRLEGNAEDDDASETSSSDSDSDSGDESDSGPQASGSVPFESDAMDVTPEETELSFPEKLVTLREALETAKIEKGQLSEQRWAMEQQRASVQKEKNAFCSLKRSESASLLLKEDFRAGLKLLDDENEDPEDINPVKPRTDYSTIDLPVFPCATRDFLRLNGQVAGDGEATCFTNVEDTGILELQKWCHCLTSVARERASKRFLNRLRMFTQQVQNYIQTIGDTSAANRLALRKKWETPSDIPKAHVQPNDGRERVRTRRSSLFSQELPVRHRTVVKKSPELDEENDLFLDSDWPFTRRNRRRLGVNGGSSSGSRSSSSQVSSQSSVPRRAVFNKPSCTDSGRTAVNTDFHHGLKNIPLDAAGMPVGITSRLRQEFSELVDECVETLKHQFVDALDEKCKSGAESASALAVETAHKFAKQLPWNTYRATLRRMGSYQYRGRNIDLNVDLVQPFAKNISNAWSTLFQTDMLKHFEEGITKAITRLLDDFQESVSEEVKESATAQRELCLKDAKLNLSNTKDAVNLTIAKQQRKISRSMAPHVQELMEETYSLAVKEKGTGSSRRRQTLIREFLEKEANRNEMFKGGAKAIMGRLDKVAVAVGNALYESVGTDLAQKIEVNLSVLWEVVYDDPAQIRARKNMAEVVAGVNGQLGLWLEAARENYARQQLELNDELRDEEFDIGSD